MYLRLDDIATVANLPQWKGFLFWSISCDFIEFHAFLTFRVLQDSSQPFKHSLDAMNAIQKRAIKFKRNIKFLKGQSWDFQYYSSYNFSIDIH